jgi:hypothetical protein
MQGKVLYPNYQKHHKKSDIKQGIKPPSSNEPPPPPAPPKATGRPNFYKRLKDTASTVADAAASELGTSIIENVINEKDKYIQHLP